ncbi:MAG: hypothetical protein M1458_02420 [Deltaproteobacteria bacterium]|nr:hypothetical protein [Deltaproteobacteria bacterium]
MKIKYDLEYILGITELDGDRVGELLKYFAELPLMGKLEVFHISKLIEEDNEFAFLQRYFDKQKTAEYEFSLFLLAVDRLFLLENKDTENKNLSSYKLKKISTIKSFRNPVDGKDFQK